MLAAVRHQGTRGITKSLARPEVDLSSPRAASADLVARWGRSAGLLGMRHSAGTRGLQRRRERVTCAEHAIDPHDQPRSTLDRREGVALLLRDPSLRWKLPDPRAHRGPAVRRRPLARRASRLFAHEDS